MKEKFGHLNFLVVALIVILVVAGCQTGRVDSVNLLLQPDSPTMVSFPLLAASQIYDFTADAQLPIQINLTPITRTLIFTAELRDERGGLMATVASSTIQNAVLTVDPGTQRYQVVIKSDNTTLQGILSMQVARSNTIVDTTTAMRFAAPVTQQQAPIVPFQPVALTTVVPYAPCSVTSSSGVNINLRSGPGLDFSIEGTLVYGTALSVNGHSNGWYQVIDNGRTVWVSGSVTSTSGDCSAVPDVTPPVLDTGTVQLVIADYGWGSVTENIESNSFHSNDLIVISAPNASDAQQAYQEIALTLICSGSGEDSLRWGASEQPTLKCGSSVVMPLTARYRQQEIAVTMPPTAISTSVQYTLMAARRG